MILIPVLSRYYPAPLARGSNQSTVRPRCSGRRRRDRWFGVFRAVPGPTMLRKLSSGRPRTALSRANDVALRKIEPRLFAVYFEAISQCALVHWISGLLRCSAATLLPGLCRGL
jgi:hypothetical protein